MKKKRSKKTGNAKSHGETNLSDTAIPVDEAEPAPTENGSPAHPHDRLFTEVFSTQEAQQDLVGMALPPEITSRFRMKTVRDAGQEINTGRMDLVLTVETIDGTTEYVYVLVEHKSYRDAKVAVQLLGYVAGIMRKHGDLRKPSTKTQTRRGVSHPAATPSTCVTTSLTWKKYHQSRSPSAPVRSPPQA